MSFCCSIIIVEDVIKSKEFYVNILGMEVEEDFGEFNYGLKNGLSIYQKKIFF